MRSVRLAVAVLGTSLMLGGCSLQRTVAEAFQPSGRTEQSVAELPLFERVQTTQNSRVWCWAACAEMVHAYNGRRGPEFTQQAIAERVTGVGDPNSPEVRGASVVQIMHALVPEAHVSLSRVGRIVGKGVTSQLTLDDRDVQTVLNNLPTLFLDQDEPDQLVIDALNSRNPAVLLIKPENAGEIGHAVVVTRVVYTDRATVIGGVTVRSAQVISLSVADPQRPDWGQVLTMLDREEFVARTERVLTLENSRDYLERLGKVLGDD